MVVLNKLKVPSVMPGHLPASSQSSYFNSTPNPASQHCPVRSEGGIKTGSPPVAVAAPPAGCPWLWRLSQVLCAASALPLFSGSASFQSPPPTSRKTSLQHPVLCLLPLSPHCPNWESLRTGTWSQSSTVPAAHTGSTRPLSNKGLCHTGNICPC